MGESNDVKKKEKRKFFVEKKGEVEELWIMWKDERDEDNNEEKETVGNCWEKWRGGNTPDG